MQRVEPLDVQALPEPVVVVDVSTTWTAIGRGVLIDYANGSVASQPSTT